MAGFQRNASSRCSWNGWFCLVLLGLLSMQSVVAQSTGMQAHFGDSSFAAGMTYDQTQDLLYMTGQVGNNGCFVGLMKQSTMTFISKLILPEPAICQGVITSPEGATTAMVIASTEEGGLLTNTRTPGSTKATEYGLIVPLHWNPTGDTVTMPQGRLFHEDFVQYPRSILKVPNDANFVYVVSIHSEDRSLSPDFAASTDPMPNLTPSGIVKYGSNFFMQVERLKYNALNAAEAPLEGSVAVEFDWRKPYGLALSTLENKPSVSIANVIYNQGALVIAGSTAGSGPAFGTSTTDDTQLEGFLTKLDPETGKIWSKVGEKEVQRYTHSNTSGDFGTIIHAICSSDENAQEIFLVGTYRGDAPGSDVLLEHIAFLTKVDATSLETIWETDFKFTQNAVAHGCAVDAAQGVVYVAGSVRDGGTYGTETTSLGGDDVFVAQSQISDGHANWLRQIGTQGNDNIARGNNGLAVVPNQGVVLFGNTQGDFMSTKQKGTEVFVLAMDSTGTAPATTETGGPQNDGGSVAVDRPLRVGEEAATDGGNTDDNRPPPDSATTPPTDATPPPPPPPDTNTDGGNNIIQENSGTGNGFFMMLMIGVLAVVLLTGYCLKSRKQEKVTERTLVFSYLQNFDLKDIDVRHSATGGWHGTYVGQLAKGEGQGTDISSMSHSSIVKDSLFVDYDTKAYSDDHSNFRIDEEEDDDDDKDFENIGRLEASKDSAEKDEWGHDII